MMKKWYRSRRNQILIILMMIAMCVVYYVSLNDSLVERDLDLTRSLIVHTDKIVQNYPASKTAQKSSTASNTPQNRSAFKTERNRSTTSEIEINRNAASKTEQNSRTTSKIVQNRSTASKSEQHRSPAPESAQNIRTAPIPDPSSVDVTNRNSIIEYIESRLQEALKEDKGTGCEIPQLDPFAKEVTQFNKDLPKVVCGGRDWVKCYLHECRVIKEILDAAESVKCNYQDIIYISDAKYTVGAPKAVLGGDPYILYKSDHVKIMCSGKFKDKLFPSRWLGFGAGYRKGSERAPLAGAGGPIDVLIFGFDSTSKNGFIRKMPKSYKYLVEELGVTVLNGYNIVGDGTPAALFPILTGKTELELPDVRRSMNKGTLDDMPFIFYKLKERGFHTAYYEDMPNIGTFQYRFNGFKRQPADHYLRAFYLEEANRNWYSTRPGKYCVGDTPRHELMMNITEQFFKLPGSHFAFSFIADITHDDFNMISTADEATVRFLRALSDAGHLDRTVLFVMGDHGPRYADVRDTLQGKLEERLPLMAIRLPRALTDKRPGILANLVANADALTTPHDIHATVLDALDMKQYMNPYKIRGADLKRGLSLFEPISRNRSCSEAGIEPHWCACLTWRHVASDEPAHGKAADAFITFINSLTEPVRSLCVPRTLISISWVMVQRANTKLLAFKGARDHDGYVGSFDAITTRTKENYQIKVSVGPGLGVYEASATYIIHKDKFIFDVRDVSRVNAYADEPSCISATHPHLNKYCYCKDHLNAT